MWFCHKCDKWYDDAVTILKHFQNRHASAPLPIQKKEQMMSIAEGKVKIKDSKMHILKPTIAKLVVKKKKNAEIMNGILKSSQETGNNSFKIVSKNNTKSIDGFKAQVKNVTVVPNHPPPKNIGLMQVTNRKASSASDQVMIVGKLNEDGVLNNIRTYICKFCCRRFPNSELLQTHVQTHQGNPKHSCHLCGLTAGTFSALMAHYVKHSGLKTFTVSKKPNEGEIYFREPQNKKQSAERPASSIFCKQCKRYFNSKKLFSIHHCPVLNNKTEYVCAYCRQVTTTVEEYRDHIQSHSSSSPFSCNHCSSKFNQRVQLQQHMKYCSKKASKSSGISKKKTSKGTSEKQTKPQKITPKVGEAKALTTSLTAKATSPTAKATSPTAKSKKHSDSVSESVKKLKTGFSNASRDNISYQDLSQEKSVPKVHTSVKANELLTPIHNNKVMSLKSEDDIHQRLRPKKAKVVYTSDSSPDDNGNSLQPTRRSARLVNRRNSRFSRHSSDSETIEADLKIVNESITNPNLVSPTSPIIAPFSGKHAELSSPKKDDVNKTKTSSSSPENKAKCQKNALLSTKKVTINCPQNIVASSPKKTTPVKCKKPSVKLGGKMENKSNTLFCNLCSLIFRSKGSLKRHKKMHSGKPQFVCQFCGKFFYRRDIHRRHESNVHQYLSTQPYTCYYCKCVFNNSEQLKKHTFDAHSGKALAPERIRRCTPSKKELQISVTLERNSESPPELADSVIKEELDDTKDEASSCSESKNLYTSYNCGMCDISFDSPPNLVKHFEEVHGMVNNLNIVQVQKHDEGQMSKKTNSLSTCDETESDASHSVPPPPCEKTESSSLHMDVNPACEVSSATTCDPTVRDKNLVSTENFSWKSTEYSCSVCFTALPERGTLMCIGPEVHRSVDWYQCMLCSVTGSQQQVLDHMKQHMNKIGTFVVNVNDKNFTGITKYMQYLNQNSLGTEKNDCVVQDFDVSPEHVLSIDTLMEEVICGRCNEIIVDLNLLLSHPCKEMTAGVYTCFVKHCTFSSGTQSEFQNHLKLYHYKAIGVDEQSLQGMSIPDSMQEDHNYLDLDFRTDEDCGSSIVKHSPSETFTNINYSVL